MELRVCNLDLLPMKVFTTSSTGFERHSPKKVGHAAPTSLISHRRFCSPGARFTTGTPTEKSKQTQATTTTIQRTNRPIRDNATGPPSIERVPGRTFARRLCQRFAHDWPIQRVHTDEGPGSKRLGYTVNVSSSRYFLM